MPYKDKEKERARGIRRREYFRKYNLDKYRKFRLEHPLKPIKLGLCRDEVGIIGEKEFLKTFPNAKWIGYPYDGECSYGRVDIKTSKPHPFDYTNCKRWRFDISRQIGKVDNFILFCLNEKSEIARLLVVPANSLTTKSGITIMVGRKSKYDKFIVPHI